jgi:hypothetical protein
VKQLLKTNDVSFPQVDSLRGFILYLLHHEADGLCTSNLPLRDVSAATIRNGIADLRIHGWQIRLHFRCKDFEQYVLVRPQLEAERQGDYCLFRSELLKYWSGRLSSEWRAT